MKSCGWSLVLWPLWAVIVVCTYPDGLGVYRSLPGELRWLLPAWRGDLDMLTVTAAFAPVFGLGTLVRRARSRIVRAGVVALALLAATGASLGYATLSGPWKITTPCYGLVMWLVSETGRACVMGAVLGGLMTAVGVLVDGLADRQCDGLRWVIGATGRPVATLACSAAAGALLGHGLRETMMLDAGPWREEWDRVCLIAGPHRLTLHLVVAAVACLPPARATMTWMPEASGATSPECGARSASTARRGCRAPSAAAAWDRPGTAGRSGAGRTRRGSRRGHRRG
jgi:hypothetical protein